MKIKRILSTALVLVLLFASVSVVIPATEAEAAYSPSSSVSEATMTLDEIKTYVSEQYLKYNFSSAEEMLAYELEAGYLDYSTTADGLYSIYVNRYTGFLYYRNNFSGQILTSNPVNPGYSKLTTVIAEDIMSQLSIKMYETSVSSNQFNYNSVHWGSMYGQISVSEIAGGLRVNYTLGDTSTRYLLPGIITAEDFTNDIIVPMLNALGDKFEEINPDLAFDFVGSKYDTIAETGYIEFSKLQGYITEVQMLTNNNKQIYNGYINPIMLLSNAYSLKNPALFEGDTETLANWAKLYPITAEGVAVYVFDMTVDNSIKKEYSNYIKTLCPDYTITDMYEDEAECGYVHKEEQKLVLRCALEYTFNDDGSLSVRLPANSISFDETVYTLKSITPLQYFGCGDMTEEGFIFFPDGSGTVVSFGDFYNEDTGKKTNLSLYADVFGHDYCYSTITGAHRQQITMPVYGLVTKLNNNETTEEMVEAAGATLKEKTETGYFAILEEGATLAQLNFISGGSSHKFVNVYASYSPYPSDEYDLSKTLSVGSLGTYTIVSKSKYTGSYITRYTMLVDDSIGMPLYGAGGYYNTTYSGMASYYRNYLKADGTLGALELMSDDIPLYIETFGTMSILTKVLTFPVETTIPLTTFEDIVTMYNELAKATEHVQELIDECYANAEAAEEEVQKEIYRLQAKEYEELLTKIADVKNINFRLTGFANGGMYFTYPTKVKWERKCGGKDGFVDLVATAKAASGESGINFGIYPEFDFMYISNTSAFDGINKRNTASRMVDNRYASKQIYNAVLQKYENFFTLVISSDALDSLYTKFLKDYSEYDIKNLSASTLGSDINSNFDKDNSINRDQARQDVIALLDRIANTDGYSLMVDSGNIYTVKYAEHILNVATDSSHFQFSSYAVPFVGMILHGHVNYAGTPINYSGSTDYEILRSIENGAAPYFILCYQNTSYMKEDEQLNKYYGVNYGAWYADMLVAYHELNSQIGSLQDYEITDHKTVIVERNREESEKLSNYKNLEAEYLELLENDVIAKLNAKFAELKEAGKYDERVKVVFDTAAIIAQLKTAIEANDLTFDEAAFVAKLNVLVASYTDQYPGSENDALNVEVTIGAMDDYVSKYSFYTLSDCLADDDYVVTDYTLDNGKVAIVTYQKGDSVVRFILNYNIYTVNVRLDGELYTLDKYSYVKVEG